MLRRKADVPCDFRLAIVIGGALAPHRTYFFIVIEVESARTPDIPIVDPWERAAGMIQKDMLNAGPVWQAGIRAECAGRTAISISECP